MKLQAFDGSFRVKLDPWITEDDPGQAGMASELTSGFSKVRRALVLPKVFETRAFKRNW